VGKFSFFTLVLRVPISLGNFDIFYTRGICQAWFSVFAKYALLTSAHSPITHSFIKYTGGGGGKKGGVGVFKIWGGGVGGGEKIYGGKKKIFF